MEILKGEIYYCNLPQTENSSLQGGIRPCIIYNNNMSNRFSDAIRVIPLTSKLKRTDLPCHIVIEANLQNGLPTTSMALVEQTTTIKKSHILEKIGYVGKDIEEKLTYSDMVQSGSLKKSSMSRENLELLRKFCCIVNNGKTEQALQVLKECV